MDVFFDTLKWITNNILYNSNTRLKYSTGIFSTALLAILAACGPVQVAPPPTEVQVEITTVAGVLTQYALTRAVLPTVPTASSTVTRMPTAPPFDIPTYSVIPTQTPVVTPLVNKPLIDAWQTQIALETPVRTPITPIRNDKLPRVYIEEGNLYFQNSLDQSVQLTNSGKDRDPILSDDGKKIAFYRGEASDNLHSINSDGSQEQTIIASETPLLVGKGEIKSPTFIPGTHLLLFNTFLCAPSKGLYDFPDCKIGVYSLDADTKNINKVVENISGNSMRNSNFEISPDGNYVSVAGEGHINIYYISSGQLKIAYPNVLTYYITLDDEYLPKQYWFPDSSGLIIICAADNEYNEPAGPPWSYVPFRYIIGSNLATQISLNKTILLDVQRDDWSISPDRKWILFASNETGDLRDEILVYLGNFVNGSTQAYSETEWPLYWYKWSPDSRHFAHTNAIGFIGSVDELPVPIGGHFMEWIDATHYYYMVIDNTANTTLIYKGEIDNK